MAVTVRQAGPGDEAAIVRLVREMAEGEDDASPIDEHYARHFLASPVNGVLLAADGDEIVGLLGYSIVPGLYHAADSGCIEPLVVTAGRRGEGIGRRLVDTAMKVFAEAHCAEVSVSTGSENETAQKLYCDAGLTEASVLLEQHFTR